MALTFAYDGEDITGDVLPTVTTSTGTVWSDSGTFTLDVAPASGWLSGTFTTTPSTGGLSIRRRISPADQKIIDGFLIDSFARGFAQESWDRTEDSDFV